MTFKIFLLCAFVQLGRPQDFLPFLQPFRPALLVTVLAVVAMVFGSSQRELSASLSTAEAKRYLLFCLIMVIGIPFAYHRRVAFESIVFEYSATILFFVLLVSQVTSLQRLKSLIWVICICTVMYGVFGGILESSSVVRLQAVGRMYDPNDTAYLLISFMPLCLYFLRFDEGLLKKLAAIVAVCGAVATILLTGSRGGILGFGAVLLVIFLSRIGGIGAGLKVLISLMLIAAWLAVGERVDIERYLSLTDISTDYNVTAQGGRLDLWKAAIALSFTNPLTGVGVNCFSWAHYLDRVGAGDTYRVMHSVHNSFLQVAAEVGLVGFAVYMLMIVRSLGTFYRYSKPGSQYQTREAKELTGLCGCMVLGFVGLLVAGFFLTHGYSTILTLYFGLAAVVRRLNAAEPAPSVQSAHAASDASKDYRRGGMPAR